MMEQTNCDPLAGIDVLTLRDCAMELNNKGLLTTQEVRKIKLDGGWLVIPKNYLVHGDVSRAHAMAMLGAGDHDDSKINLEIRKIREVRKIVKTEAGLLVRKGMKQIAVKGKFTVKDWLRPEVIPRPVLTFEDLKAM